MPLAKLDGGARLSVVLALSVCSASLADAQGLVWIQRMAGAGAPFPSARWGHALALDGMRGGTTLFGGNTAGEIAGAPRVDNDETWRWNGSSWARSVVAGEAPSPRTSFAMAYDRVRGVTVLFGGYAGSDAGNAETWEWNGTAWTERDAGSSGGPSPRSYHAMAFDTLRGRTVLFGGLGGGLHGDTWEWDGSAWALVDGGGEGRPAPRAVHAMAYDEVRGVTVLFGGSLGSSSPDRWNGETWEWNGSTWTRPPVIGAAPVARFGHAMAFDAAIGKTVLFGGELEGLNQYNGETWTWDGTAWTQLLIAGPSVRSSHAMAYDAAKHEVVLFGGQGVGGGVDSNNETWVLRAVCRADFDGSGALSIQDVFEFLNAWFRGDPRCDFDREHGLTVTDVFSFLDAWFAGCP